MEWGGHQTRVKVYPISINVSEVQRIANSPRALDYEARLAPLCGESTIMRIDRGEPNKEHYPGFQAYELLLTRYPDLRGRVTFMRFSYLPNSYTPIPTVHGRNPTSSQPDQPIVWQR